jgi:Family of unknown function (DUF5677)
MYQVYTDKEKEELYKFSELIKDYSKIGMELINHRMNFKENLRTDYASCFLFRQIIETSDAISELIKIGVINASKPLLRTLLECYFQLSFLFQSDHDRKALQLMYHNEIRKKDYYENLAYSDKDGSFHQRLKNDKHLKGLDISQEQKEVYIDNIRKINETINVADYEEIKKEYDRIETEKSKLRGKQYKVKYWYELFDGPKNAERIMIKLKEVALYEFIYRECSAYSHGEDIIHPNLEPKDEDSLGISAFRDIRQLSTIANNAIMLIERSCLLFLKNKIDEPKAFAERLFPFIKKAEEYGKDM